MSHVTAGAAAAMWGVRGVLGSVGAAHAAHVSHVRRLPQPGEEREVRGSDRGRGCYSADSSELRNLEFCPSFEE